jgi:hypothetical protein
MHRRRKDKSKIVAYYLGNIHYIHIVQKLTYDDSVILAIVIHEDKLEILPRIGVPIDRNGLVNCVPMTGITMKHLEYAEQEMAKGNIVPRPKPKPLPKKLRSKKKTPKPLSPEQMGAISLLEQGVKVREIVAATGLTRNKIYVLKRKFT